MKRSIYYRYFDQRTSNICRSCNGFGHNVQPPVPVECTDCLGTGLNISKDNQEDKEFISNMLNVFTAEYDWRNKRNSIIETLEVNPALRIIDVHDDPDTFIITFRSHALLIKDGKLSKFF